MGDRIIMSEKELNRLETIHQALSGQISRVTASNILGLSYRQTKRIVKRIKQYGGKGIIHRNKGKPSLRKIPKSIENKITSIYAQPRKRNIGRFISGDSKDHRGKMIQIDGSHHNWIEDRCEEKNCIMAYIDDAVSEVFARFYGYEGVIPALDSFLRFSKQYGLPKSFYADSDRGDIPFFIDLKLEISFNNTR